MLGLFFLSVPVVEEEMWVTKSQSMEDGISMGKHHCLGLKGWSGFIGTVIDPLWAVHGLGSGLLWEQCTGHVSHYDPGALLPYTYSARCSLFRDVLGVLLQRSPSQCAFSATCSPLATS